MLHYLALTKSSTKLHHHPVSWFIRFSRVIVKKLKKLLKYYNDPNNFYNIKY